MLNRRSRHVVAAVLMLGPGSGICSIARATTIGVNWDGGKSSLDMAPTDQPGVIAGADWNNLSANSGSAIPIHDNTGAFVATLSYSGITTIEYGGEPKPTTPNAATNTMYVGCYTNAGNTSSITLTSVPYSTYDVYTYATGGGAGISLSIGDGTTTYYYNNQNDFTGSSMTLVTSTSSGSPTTSAGPDYELFHEVGGSPVTFTVGAGESGVVSNQIYGLEIVNTGSVPEPASISLLAVTAIGLLSRRRTTI